LLTISGSSKALRVQYEKGNRAITWAINSSYNGTSTLPRDMWPGQLQTTTQKRSISAGKMY